MVEQLNAPSGTDLASPGSAGGSEISNPTSFSEFSTQFRPLDLTTDAPTFLDSQSPPSMLAATEESWDLYNQAFEGKPDNYLDPDAEPTFWDQDPIQFEVHPENDHGVVGQAIEELNDQIAEQVEAEVAKLPNSKTEFTKADKELFVDLENLAELTEPQSDALEVPLIEKVEVEETGLVEILESPEELLQPEIIEALTDQTEVEAQNVDEVGEILPANLELSEEQVQVVAENKALVKNLVDVLNVDAKEVAAKIQHNLQEEKGINVEMEMLLPDEETDAEVEETQELAILPNQDMEEPEQQEEDAKPYNLVVDERAMRKRFKAAEEEIGNRSALGEIDNGLVAEKVAKDEESKSGVILDGQDGSLENIREQGKQLGISQSPEEAERKIKQVIIQNRAVTVDEKSTDGVSMSEFEAANKGRDTLRIKDQAAQILEKRPDGLIAAPLNRAA
jgi:hypothetical protein